MNQIDQSVDQIKSVSLFFRDASVLVSLYHGIIPHVASAHVTHNRGFSTYSTVVYWIKHHSPSDSSTDAYWASGATSRGGPTTTNFRKIKRNFLKIYVNETTNVVYNASKSKKIRFWKEIQKHFFNETIEHVIHYTLQGIDTNEKYSYEYDVLMFRYELSV